MWFETEPVYEYLETADYTIDEYRSLLQIERKTMEDICGTLTEGRDRFQAENERMRDCVSNGGYACIIIEGSPLPHMMPDRGVHYDSLLTTSVSWAMKYGVPWIWAGDRATAETMALRIMSAWYEKRKYAEKRSRLERAATAPSAEDLNSVSSSLLSLENVRGVSKKTAAAICAAFPVVGDVCKRRRTEGFSSWVPPGKTRGLGRVVEDRLVEHLTHWLEGRQNSHGSTEIGETERHDRQTESATQDDTLGFK